MFWLFLGIFGAHRFYTNNIGTGIIWLFTLGLCGIGFIYDAFRMPTLVERANKGYNANGSYSTPDADDGLDIFEIFESIFD